MNTVLRPICSWFVVIGAWLGAFQVTAPTASGQALGPDSTVDAVLDALHARGVGLRDFTADVQLADVDTLSGNTSVQSGQVWFDARAEGQERVRVTFLSRRVEGAVDNDARSDYVLANGVLIERDYKARVEVTRQVLRPGERINLLKLGEGPFPLPVGQPREEVLRQFQVRKLEVAADDPPRTIRLELRPRPDTDFAAKFHRIEVWVQMETGFPVRIMTVPPRRLNRNVTDLANIRVNAGVPDSVFAMESIDGKGWRRITETMPK